MSQYIKERCLEAGYYYQIHWCELAINNPKQYHFEFKARYYYDAEQEDFEELLLFADDNDLPIDYREFTDLEEDEYCFLVATTDCIVNVGPLTEYQAILFKLRFSESIYANE